MRNRFSRTATTLAAAIAIVVVGGVAVASLALASKGAGLIPTSDFGTPSDGPSGFPTIGPSASPFDDKGGDRDDDFCEPGDDCGGLRRTPTPSIDDDRRHGGDDDRHGDDDRRHGHDDRHGDDRHGGDDDDDDNSGPGGGHGADDRGYDDH